jgi:hypothetical protein
MKKTIRVPESAGDITLRQWQEYVAIEEPTDEQCVQIFCDLTAIEVLGLPADVYDKVIKKLVVALSNIDTNGAVIKRFKHRGKMYGMIPNLDKITYGANKDIIATIGEWESIHWAMNALYRPIVKTVGDYYEIEEYKGEETIEAIRDMPLDVVIHARVFFYNLTRALLKAIPNYLVRELERAGQDKTQTQYINENGEAMMKHIALLRETLEDGMK